MDEEDLWREGFGEETAPRTVRFYSDDPFAGDAREDSGSFSEEPEGVVRDEFVTDYETEMNIRGAKGGTFKDPSRMTPEERARVNLMSVLADYEIGNPSSTADSIVKWFSQKNRRDLSRMHLPTFVCAWLWHKKNGGSLKGLPTWCAKYKVDELSAATYLAILNQ